MSDHTRAAGGSPDPAQPPQTALPAADADADANGHHPSGFDDAPRRDAVYKHGFDADDVGGRDAAPRRSVALVLAIAGVAMGVGALIAFGLTSDTRSTTPSGVTAAVAAPGGHDHGAAAAPAAGAANVRFEPYRRPDPTLPAVPAGSVKRFRVVAYMHVAKVADDRPPLRVWSFGVNGRFLRGTGASPPMVVEQGDRVDITFVNGGSRRMDVTMPHSLDIHAAEVAPNVAFKTIPPGATWHYRFVARDPGVFMYHCATAPMVWHLASGMVGMFVVKPRNLTKVDRELWLTQQEYFLPRKPGADSDMAKMLQERPDVIAFNGYGHQYMSHPIHVRRGERVRVYVLNPGPTHASSFHVIGAIFDHTYSEGVRGRDAQVLTLAPSTGGWVDFTLRRQGAYPFVDHNFASMSKGAMGAMVTEHAPAGALSGF
jgi:nitrite reductase (NO-forming)